MNLKDSRYHRHALVREMMDTIAVVRDFDRNQTRAIAAEIARTGRLFLTGEGSSRIFPAKNAIRKALTWGLNLALATDGSRQAFGYDLSQFALFCASNSGRTKEVILLAQKLAAQGHSRRYGLSANPGTPLEQACAQTFVLTCGWEQAVAATKSVIEQALFYESIIRHIAGTIGELDCQALAGQLETALTLTIDPAIVTAATRAPTLYFAGYNDGVAEELTLKTNEITRKKSDFLEGTYAVHGIEEVMDPADVVFVVDPIETEEEKFQQVLTQGVGLTVIALASRATRFTTIHLPDAGPFAPYIQLAAGWNLLVEIGLALGIDLDKPTRARKVGNEIAP